MYAICCHALMMPAPGSYHGGGAKKPPASPSARAPSPKPSMHSVITAWVYLGVILGAAGLAWMLGSWMPVLLVGPLPTMYGGWLNNILALTQHTGLAVNVKDHRLNTRTIYMGPLMRFLYMNMNYHLEHHFYPTVPYYNLPLLHEAIKDQCPMPYNGLRETMAELLPALWRQLQDPSYYILRTLPAMAQKPA